MLLRDVLVSPLNRWCREVFFPECRSLLVAESWPAFESLLIGRAPVADSPVDPGMVEPEPLVVVEPAPEPMSDVLPMLVPAPLVVPDVPPVAWAQVDPAAMAMPAARSDATSLRMSISSE